MQIDKNYQHLYAARSEAEMIMRAKAVQVRAANRKTDFNCNVKRFQHWQDRTSSMVLTVNCGSKTKTLLITSNN